MVWVAVTTLGWPALNSLLVWHRRRGRVCLINLFGGTAGQGTIWHADTGEIASAASPAAAGDVLALYTTNLFQDSLVAPQVSIGGQSAEVPGYYQVNFRMPNGSRRGRRLPVRLTYLGRASNEVTIGVR